jgi:hypothetical protein
METISRRYEVHPRKEWTRMLSDAQWEVYGPVLREARKRGLPFALGGGFAIAAYTGQCRATKDLDIYIVHRDRDAMVDVVSSLGLRDYYEKLPYDRSWIYRSYTGDVIVDIIWAMANHRTEVDDDWLERGPDVELRGDRFQVIPAEEMVWDKLHVLQRDRCDWPDALNLLYAIGPDLDWEHLIERAGFDRPLLSAALWMLSYVSPGRARQLPDWLWDRLRVPPPPPGADVERHHVELLDRRPWFAIPETECLPSR